MKTPLMTRLLVSLVATATLGACAAQPTAPVAANDAAPPSASSKAVEAARQQAAAQVSAPKELTPEERARHQAVSERSRQRTAAIMKRDYPLGYSFSTPAWRALYSVDHFRGQVGGVTAWKNAEVIDVKCENTDQCRTRVRVETITFASGQRGATLTTHIDELWARDGEQWFFVEYK